MAGNVHYHAVIKLPAGVHPNDIEASVELGGTSLKVTYIWHEDMLNELALTSIFPKLLANPNHAIVQAFGDTIRDLHLTSTSQVVSVQQPEQVDKVLHSKLGHQGFTIGVLESGMCVLWVAMMRVQSNWLQAPQVTTFIGRGGVPVNLGLHGSPILTPSPVA